MNEFLSSYKTPAIDLIAVTRGPGLEPALWTGITFAQALSAAWNVPVVGIDHMEAHLVASLLARTDADVTRLPAKALAQAGTNAEQTQIDAEKLEPRSYKLEPASLPLLALLISGGHTELVLMRDWFSYELLGATKDDAVGEAFDKVARLLGLPYPGGPHIAELASRARTNADSTRTNAEKIIFPRPMASDTTCDFSFSAIKTAVLYKLKSIRSVNDTDREHIAQAFEDAVRDILVIKTRRALEEAKPKTLVVGGGVSANTHIRKGIEKLIGKEFSDVSLHFPDPSLTGDNAIMIGAAAYLRHITGRENGRDIRAEGSLMLHR